MRESMEVNIQSLKSMLLKQRSYYEVHSLPAHTHTDTHTYIYTDTHIYVHTYMHTMLYYCLNIHAQVCTMLTCCTVCVTMIYSTSN